MDHPVALTFDIEDWFHPELVREAVPPGDARSVVREGTDAILEQLRRHKARSTFFVLGEVAARHPDLIRRIADEGHEIASHGMTHRSLWKLDRESFRRELQDARAAVSAALGADPIVGFRAPTFSLDRSTSWALDVLREEGFLYDSSIFPTRVRLYGVEGAPLGIYRPAPENLARHDPEGTLVEFPVAVANLGGIRVPAAGGFYLRVLPSRAFVRLLDGIVRERPFNLFLHPWECVPNVPRVPLRAMDAFITYVNLPGVLAKLDRLLERFRSVPMREILEETGHLSQRTRAARSS